MTRPEPEPRTGMVRRRTFLAGAGATIAVGACRTGGESGSGPDTSGPGEPTPPGAPTSLPDLLDPVDHGPPTGASPFTLGVAAGDPDASSVVVWTRVDRDVAVVAEVALDDGFELIVDRRDVVIDADADNTTRTVVDGLAPDTAYWYRFVADGHLTAPARARTAPAPGALPATPLRVGHVSCQQRSAAYWMALDDLAVEGPDLVVCCGDYIYEADERPVRPAGDDLPVTLDDYRSIYRRYRSDPSLQAAHAAAPWLVVWDDHEVENNYQGTDPGDPPDGEAFLAQRAAAYRAWWEYVPTRLDPPDGPNLRIHRTVDWGALTRFTLLDTRQYRDDQPCGDDIGPRCGQVESLTMLGADQEAWFDESATGHDAVWTAVVQQVVLHQWRFLGGNTLWNLDQWDGYTGARTTMLDVLSRAPSPVVLTGDVHSSWVSDLPPDFDTEPGGPGDANASVAVEFVTPGVSSAIPGALRGAGILIEGSSPHVRWSETRSRGWVLHTITEDAWESSYRLVADAEVEGSPVTEARRWRVDAGDRRVGDA